MKKKSGNWRDWGLATKTGVLVLIMLLWAMIAVLIASIIGARNIVISMLENECEVADNILATALDTNVTLDELDGLLDPLKQSANCDLGVFQNGTCTMSTLSVDGESIVGSAIPSNIQAMLNRGETYLGEQKLMGENLLVSYEPHQMRDGTSVVLFAAKSRAMVTELLSQGVISATLIGIVTIVLCLIILSYFLRRRVEAPLARVTEAAERIENGDLGIKSGEPFVFIGAESGDEVGRLARAFNTTVERLSNYIANITHALHAIANGDMTFPVDDDYVGDFESIHDSMVEIEHKLDRTLQNIRTSADQIHVGASQVANSSQALAQGTTEQASTVADLADQMAEISKSADDTVGATHQANALIEEASMHLGSSMESLEGLNTAMRKISDTSGQIGQIISVIQNIAFQTNLLALNAAVEAARAGAAGKGFAVVADEVRNLASRSDEAAKSTKDLIESSLVSVGEGSDAVAAVTVGLEQTAKSAGNITTHMDTVINAITSQNVAIAHVREGIDQISDVVQEAAASTEETAAASEELSGQADLMNRLVSQFKLSAEENKHF